MNVWKYLTYLFALLFFLGLLINLRVLLITQLEGWSMYPTIKPGSWIVCVKSPVYKPGDIVVYKPRWIEGVYVAHRIIYIDEAGFYYLKGDNPITNPRLDYYPATYGDIICKVVFHT